MQGVCKQMARVSDSLCQNTRTNNPPNKPANKRASKRKCEQSKTMNQEGAIAYKLVGPVMVKQNPDDAKAVGSLLSLLVWLLAWLLASLLVICVFVCLIVGVISLRRTDRLMTHVKQSAFKCFSSLVCLMLCCFV